MKTNAEISRNWRAKLTEVERIHYRKKANQWMRDQYNNDPEARQRRLRSSKRWHMDHPDRVTTYLRRKKLRRYGLTLEQYDRMVEGQKGLCAICGHPPFPRKNLGVDHNHKTGKVRGLLCHNCNLALGHVERNDGSLIGLYFYLQKYKGA